MTGAAAVHERYVRGAQWAGRRGRAGGRSAVEDGLLATLEPVIELSCARSNCVRLVYLP